MATANNADRRPRPQPRRPARRSPDRPPWLWIGLGLVIVIAAVVAVIASNASNGPDDATTAAGVEQTRSVQVTGTALAAFSSGTDPAVGQQMPEVRGAGFDGTPVTIARDGRAKVLAFVAHWCPHCQREVPLLAEYLAANPLPDGVDLVTVATSTSPDRPNYPPSAWLAREHWPGPILADSTDGAAAQAFGLTAFPYFVAVNDAGEIVGRASGELSTSQFAQLTQQALGVNGSAGSASTG